MSGSRLKKLRAELRLAHARTEPVTRTDERRYRKELRELKQRKNGNPRPARRNKTIHIASVAGDFGRTTGLCLGDREITPELGTWANKASQATCPACRAEMNSFLRG